MVPSSSRSGQARSLPSIPSPPPHLPHLPLSHCIRPINSLSPASLSHYFPHFSIFVCLMRPFCSPSHDRRMLSLRLVLMYVLRIQNTVFKSHRRRMEMATLVFQPIRPPHRYVNGEMGKIFVFYCHCFLFNILALYSFGPISQAE